MSRHRRVHRASIFRWPCATRRFASADGWRRNREVSRGGRTPRQALPPWTSRPDRTPSTRLAPAPTAVPLTAATTGLSQSRIEETNRCQPCCSIRAISPGRFCAMRFDCRRAAAVVDASPSTGAEVPRARGRQQHCAHRRVVVSSVKASVNASRAKGDNEFPTSARSMVMRWTPSSPSATPIPDASSLMSSIPALTAFPLFGYLNFHCRSDCDVGHEEESFDGGDRPDHR